MNDRQRDRARLIAFAATVIAGAVLAAIVAGRAHGELTAAVRSLGTAAPIGFAAAYAVLTLLLVPGSILSIVGGFLFGSLLGAALSVAGGAVGATAAYLVGRRLGREQVRRLAGPRTTRIERRLHDHGVIALVAARIVPGMPYSVLNYVAGLTGIGTRDYVVGTVLGLVPGAFAYATVGAGLADPASPQFLAGVGLVLAVILAGGVLDRRRGRHGARSQ